MSGSWFPGLRMAIVSVHHAKASRPWSNGPIFTMGPFLFVLSRPRRVREVAHLDTLASYVDELLGAAYGPADTLERLYATRPLLCTGFSAGSKIRRRVLLHSEDRQAVEDPLPTCEFTRRRLLESLRITVVRIQTQLTDEDSRRCAGCPSWEHRNHPATRETPSRRDRPRRSDAHDQVRPAGSGGRRVRLRPTQASGSHVDRHARPQPDPEACTRNPRR